MTNNVDIASGSWISKWPVLLRWVAFLPLAVLGSVATAGILMLIISFSTDTSSGTLNGGWYRLLQSCVLGGLFVYVGSYIAPKIQIVVSVAMLVLVTVIVTAAVSLTLFTGTSSAWYSVMHMLATLLGGGIAVYSVYDEINKRVGNSQWRK